MAQGYICQSLTGIFKPVHVTFDYTNEENSMQITIDKKTGSFLAVIALLAATLVGTLITRDGGSHDNHNMGKMGSSSNAQLSASDVMFLQMMIPHHQQAVEMSKLAVKSSKDAKLLALAENIADSQAREIVQMEKWLLGADDNSSMDHSMHSMGGMLSTEDLSALSAATGTTFDKLWLEGMIGHHDGAIDMTEMISNAKNPEIKTFGENVVKDQAAQIVQMKEMLKRIA